jgi:hypothetical protein
MSIWKAAVTYFKVLFWHSPGNSEESHGIISQVRWQQSRVLIRIPSERKSRKLSLRHPAGPPFSRNYVDQIQYAAKQGGKLTVSLHQKPRSPSLSLPGGHTFPRYQDTKLYGVAQKGQQPERKKNEKISICGWPNTAPHQIRNNWASVWSILNTMEQKYELNLGYITYRKLDVLDLTYVRQNVTAFGKPRNSVVYAVTRADVSADSSVLRYTKKVFFWQSLYVCI